MMTLAVKLSVSVDNSLRYLLPEISATEKKPIDPATWW
jgi:hypothetical protein